MNKLLRILFLDLKLLGKTKVFYFKLILFPCVLILTLGYMFNSQDKTLTTFDVAFYSNDTSVTSTSGKLCLSNTLRDDVLKSKDIKTYLNLKKVSSQSEGEKLVKSKKVVAFIYVPKNFTKSYLDNEKINIQLTADNTKQIDKNIVKNILERFTKNIELIRLEQSQIKDILISGSKINKEKLQSIIGTISNTSSYTNDLKEVSPNKNAKPINTMQYEAIAMIVMFSFFTAFELVHSIIDDKLNNTLFRIKSTPTLGLQYALGKVMGIVLAITVQMLIVMIICRIFFKIDLGNVFYIILITLSYGFAVGTIVFCAAIAAKDHMSISSFAAVILYGFNFLGGSFVNKASFPYALQIIQKFIPNGKAINSYFKICQGGNLSDIYLDLIELVIFGLIFLALSLKIYTKGGNKNAHIVNYKEPTKVAV